MKPKDKSHNDVMNQLTKMQLEYSGNKHLKRAYQIAEFYCNNIYKQYQCEEKEVNLYEKRSHAVRSFMYDSSRDFIRNLKPMKVDGLYCIIDGKKVTPTSLYFGVDTRLFRTDGGPCGRCYWPYACALHPVYLPNGRRYREPSFANICAYYKEGVISGFYKE